MSIEDQAQEFVKNIRVAGDPDNMSKYEWKEFLEVILSDLRSDYHAVCGELGEG